MINFNQLYDTQLHVHTEFSNLRLLDCINKVRDTIDHAVSLGVKTIAITDHQSISSHVQYMQYQQELDEKGVDINILLGDEIYLTDDVEELKENYVGGITKFPHFVLIAKDEIGYKQLRQIDTAGWKNSWKTGKLRRTIVQKSEIEEIIGDEKGHLLAQTACLGGELAILSLKYLDDPSEQNKIPIHEFITWNIETFGKENFALEIQPSKQQDQIKYNQFIMQLREAYDLYTIMTCDVHYLKEEDFNIHSAFLHSRDADRGETKTFYESTWMMPTEKKWELVKDYMDENTFLQVIADGFNFTDGCEKINMHHDIVIPERDLSLLKFEIKHIFSDWYDEYESIKNYACSEYAQDRFLFSEIEKGFLEKKQEFNEENIARINEELFYIWEVSEQLNDRMSAYYNLVDYIVDLCWEIGYVGISRGSVTGFYTMYLTGIQQMNPLKWRLPAWRHLNDQKASMPDIDLDTSARNRPKIIKKLNETFGEENVLNICTFRTEKPKSAIKTVCRGLDINDDEAAYLASLVPVERGEQWSITECLEGNENKERRPVNEFIREIDKISTYYGVDLKRMILMIEGLVSGVSTHASGIYIFKNGYIEQNSLMLTPRGDEVTAWNMDDSDWCGGLKYDSLTTECQDKLEVCMELLIEHGEIESQGSIRDTYNRYLHPDVINYDDEQMWNKCSNGQIIDLFQFITPVGGACIRKIKPHSLVELSNANSLMRITVPEGEQPIDKFIRYKKDNQLWYDELEQYGIVKTQEIEALKEILEQNYGIANTQEDIMELSMSPYITNFTKLESDKMRKIVAKKKFKEVAGLNKMFFEKADKSGNSPNVANYVWEQCITPQLAYSFSRNHTIPYSAEALQEMNLYHFYPSCFWNCAALTVNADIDEHSKGNTNYGKIAKAIYRSSNFGVPVLPPSINKSDISFTPIKKDNTILFGLGGISGVNYELAQEIISMRPYESFDDFLDKINTKEETGIKPAKVIKIIHAGCFDEFTKDRNKLLDQYIATLVTPKTKLTQANIPKMIEYGINKIPTELIRKYRFFKYVTRKDFFYKQDEHFKTKKHYRVEEEFALPFLEEHYLSEMEEGKHYYYEKDLIIIDKELEKIMKPDMRELKNYLSDADVVSAFNKGAFEEERIKRVKGMNLNQGSFDSTSYYHYNQHELDGIDFNQYNITPFSHLPEDPIFIERSYRGRTWKQFKISRICGTVVDRNDTKHMVDILTPDQEVVTVKFNDGQYAHYKKQISEIVAEKKNTLEDGWFKRGTLIMVCGYRSDEENFRAKRYKNSAYQHSVVKINQVNEDKTLELQYERIEVENNE